MPTSNFTLGQRRLPTLDQFATDAVPTLGQRIHLGRWHNVGPMSKITLDQHLFYDVGPTCTYYHGPTLAQHSHAIWDCSLSKCITVFSSPEPKAQVSYCHSAPSVVRPSVRRPSSSSSSSVWRKLFTYSTSSPEPLDGFWWNLVEMKYSWSLTSVVVFRPDPPRGGSRAGSK